MVVVAPLPDGSFRIVATIDDAPEAPGRRRHPAALLDARGPSRAQTAVEAVLWSSRFRIQHRVAASYRAGRLLLMGDAAHVHSPAGGQGMNTGLVDAVVLGGILADVVSGRRPRPGSTATARCAAPRPRGPGPRRPAHDDGRHPLGAAARAAQRALDHGRAAAGGRRLAMNLSGLARRDLAAAAPAAAARPAPTVAAKAA